MDMLDRWVVGTHLFLFVFVAVMFAGGIYMHAHQQQECRLTAIKQNLAAEDIVKICR